MDETNHAAHELATETDGPAAGAIPDAAGAPPLPTEKGLEGGSPDAAKIQVRWHALLWLLPLLGILLIGASFRLTNLHWDEGLSLHPDERFLTMVEQAIAFPDACRPFLPYPKDVEPPEVERNLGACLNDYLNSATSPLNPRNRGHGLFVYGSLPIFTLRAIIEARGIVGFAEVTLAGRVLSVIADLLTILLTFFLGKRLYGVRAGLLAALFLSLSVLNIQNAHFFTVDTFTAMITLLCVYLAVVIAEDKGGWGTFALLGLAFGGAVASKINVASFVLIIGLAGLVRIWRRLEEEGDDAFGPALRHTAIGLALAGILALATFRLAQPYAFNGPGLLGTAPDSAIDPNLSLAERLLDRILEPRYQENLATVRGLVSGEQDFPPSHQWTGRTALWFPWKNMVLWGLGLPLGLAGWAGVALAGWQLLRKRDLRHIVPLSWTLFLFIYLGIQFVKTMRYFLPIYPLLCIFAAHLLLWLWERARAQAPLPHWRTIAAGALLGVVVLGTLVWALGFIQIYLRPVTRATASRWIYDHIAIDQGAWLQLSDGSQVPVAIPNARTYKAGDPASTTPFSLENGGTLTGLTINHLQDVAKNPEEEQLEVAILADQQGQQVLATATIRGNFAGAAGDAAPGQVTFAPLTLEAGRTYYLHLRGLQGSVRTWAVALANEQWDDPQPSRVDGKDGFSIYRGLDLGPYGEDTPHKVQELLHQVANTDYVILSSNRLYDSIPRLPMRYPVTTRYYQALFDGTLGFERVATFTSYPTLFSWKNPQALPMSDEERAEEANSWTGWAIPDQSADEAFSVYDHPKVQIFHRTEAFDYDRAYAMLTEGIDWDRIARIRPIEVPGYRDLMLTEEEWSIQREGGTWSELFQRDSWNNRLSLLVWLALVEILGLAAFPLANALLGRLADGGYLPAKALGLLLLGYGSWLLAATKTLPYTRGTIALVMAGLLLLGGLVAWRRWGEIKALVRSRYKLLLLEEAIFLGGFLLFLLIRMGNPDLWHPWFGGEKPMDFAYLNAIIRSTTFPPYDPWFAGGYLNYYYFSHILTATLIKLSGILPSVAYNLALPLYYGLTCSGVFGVVLNLVHRGEEKDGWDRRAIYGGLAGVALVALLGNLGQYMLLLNKLGELGELNFESSIPGLASLVRALAGLPKAFQEGLHIGLGSWYWKASRVIMEIVERSGHGGEINEFPFFSFLYADLHPHLIALPFTLLIPTQVIALVKDRRQPTRGFWSLLPPPWILLGMALVLGALRCAHFWDFPTYILLAVSGWAVALYERRRRIDGNMIAGVGLLAILLLLLSKFLYHPFWARYGSFYTSVAPWEGGRTEVGEYLIIHGLLLFILASYLVSEVFGRGAREGTLRLIRMLLHYWDRLPTLTRRLSLWVHKPATHRALLWGGLVVLLVALFFLLPAPQLDPGIQPLGESPSLLGRLRQQHLLGWLVLMAGLGLVLFIRRHAREEDRLIALLVLAGLALTGGVELLVVKGDIGRMNTIFRFYFQAWILWGIAAAAALPRLWDRLPKWSPTARTLWLTALFTLIGLCALYPLLATPAKVHDRFPDTNLGPGLDGASFMEQATYHDEGTIVLAEDAAAIRWLQENVSGSPVVLEAHAVLYRWGSRISIHTGLPTIIGWDWHQKQQRGFLGPIVEQRVRDQHTLYESTDVEQVLDLLRKYQVSYIVVGQLERNYYPAEGLAKFERMVGQYLEQVYPVPGSDSAVPTHSPQSSPTADAYPDAPATMSNLYPGPGAPKKTESAVAQQASGSETVLYRVLPSVWQEP